MLSKFEKGDKVGVIGSRFIPDWLDGQVESLARNITFTYDATIITGGAPGVDQAAIRGSLHYGMYQAKVYLPWETFEEINLEAVNREVSPHLKDPQFQSFFNYWYGEGHTLRGTRTEKFMARNYTIIKESDKILAFPRTASGAPTGGTAFGIFVAQALKKPLEVYPIDSLHKWDICPSCGYHQQLWDCGKLFHRMKSYV